MGGHSLGTHSKPSNEKEEMMTNTICGTRFLLGDLLGLRDNGRQPQDNWEIGKQMYSGRKHALGYAKEANPLAHMVPKGRT